MKPPFSMVYVMGRLAGLAMLVAVSAVEAQAAQAPMSPSQYIGPSDLTAQELDFYRGLDPAGAKAFLATRSYVRVCLSIDQYKTPALQLPDRPPGFNIEYLLPTDPNVINRALTYYLIAENNPAEAAHPHVLEMTEAQRLRPGDLDAEESAEFKTLSGEDAADFLDTRSYVRVCRQYLDHKLANAGLPDKPLGFSPDYLLSGESAMVNDAITQSAGDSLKKAVN